MQVSDLYQHMDSENPHHQSVHATCSEDLRDRSVHPSCSEDPHHQSIHPSCSASNFMEDENVEQLRWNCQVDDVNECPSGEQEIVCISSPSDESANPCALSPGCFGPVIRTTGSVEYSQECAEECNRTVAIHATESKRIKATETSSQTTAQFSSRDSNSDCQPSLSFQTTAQYTPSDCRPSQSFQTSAQSLPSDPRPSLSNLRLCQSTRRAMRNKSNTLRENAAVETFRQESSTQREKKLSSVKEGRMKDKDHTDTGWSGTLTDREAVHRSSNHFGSYNRLHSQQSRHVPELQNQGQDMPVKERQVPNQAETRQLPNLHMSNNALEDVTDDDLFGDGPSQIPVFDLLILSDEDEEHNGGDNCQCGSDNGKEEDE